MRLETPVAARRRAGAALLCVLVSAAWAPGALAQPAPRPDSARDLTNLPLEDLLNVEVTLTARTEQSLADTAAAVYVLTEEDIRRSGASSIPEALRMVPGLQVAQIDANKWAITARGFNGRFANKLLVLLDGRSLYAPLFSGVEWELQDTVLEDIERIEVVRGPGGALWGANAVNGVINIVTRRARETRGGLLSASGGTEDRGIGGFRYGAPAGGRGHYRVYAKYFDRGDYARPPGDAADGWDAFRGGVRADWELAGGDSLTLQGDAVNEDAGQTTTVAALTSPFTQTYDEQAKFSSFNARAEWRHRFSDDSGMALQVYCDRVRREFSILSERRDTCDLDFHHRVALGDRREIIWGLGYRYTADQLGDSFSVTFTPERRASPLSSSFVELLSHPVGGRWHLALGSKFEHNDFTGFEYQPSARALWRPSDRHSVWAAVSRAVRTPSRGEEDVLLNRQVIDLGGGTTALATFSGSRDFRSEELLAFEVGYRVRPTERLSLDTATFYNRYDGLMNTVTGAAYPSPAPPPPDMIIPVVIDNGMDGRSFGAEMALNWRPSRRWSLMGGYTWLDLRLDPRPGSDQNTDAEGRAPRHQVHLRSYLDFPRGIAFDTAVYFVDRLTSLDVPGYVRLDARLAWHRAGAFEASLGVRNALDGRHPEFTYTQAYEVASEVQRSFYTKIAWRF